MAAGNPPRRSGLGMAAHNSTKGEKQNRKISPESTVTAEGGSVLTAAQNATAYMVSVMQIAKEAERFDAIAGHDLEVFAQRQQGYQRHQQGENPVGSAEDRQHDERNEDGCGEDALHLALGLTRGRCFR